MLRFVALVFLVAVSTTKLCAQTGSGESDEVQGSLDDSKLAAILMLLRSSDLNCIDPVEGDNAPALQVVLDRGDDLILCPKSIYPLKSALVFRKDRQEIYTLGVPTDEENQSRLEWATADPGNTVIGALNVSNIRLHHVTIDGMRKVFGFDDEPNPPFGALIDIDTSPGAYIGYNHIKDPRFWSSLSLGGGGCDGAVVEFNTIGPAGQSDGTWADGISFACTNGVVRHNTITDVTDGGIVVFGASGSKIHDNVIQAADRRLLGGINMVDIGFDYSGVEVFRNRIVSNGGRIKLALGMGPRAWGFACAGETPSPNEGASVYENHVTGNNFGFGYVLNGVRNWAFFNNTADATFSGTPVGCNGNVASPRAFACQQEHVNDGVCPAGTDVITLPLNLEGVILPAGQD